MCPCACTVARNIFGAQALSVLRFLVHFLPGFRLPQRLPSAPVRRCSVRFSAVTRATDRSQRSDIKTQNYRIPLSLCLLPRHSRSFEAQFNWGCLFGKTRKALVREQWLGASRALSPPTRTRSLRPEPVELMPRRLAGFLAALSVALIETKCRRRRLRKSLRSHGRNGEAAGSRLNK